MSISTIINILSTKMDNQYEDNNNKVFNIEEKIVYNNQISIKNYIYNHASSISKVIKVYEEFEKQGKNISKNVFLILFMLIKKILNVLDFY
ncbi:hypothetical protein [Mycoplasma capricolum]|uniref:hypothetical protein n=1 Tax=Mycoplasma capricolum TaxID=2095 RepID=UPI003DA47860